MVEVASAQADTRATARSADISADHSEILLPGRSTRTRTRTSVTGIAPRMSRVIRPIRIPGGSRSSMDLVNKASGGEPC